MNRTIPVGLVAAALLALPARADDAAAKEVEKAIAQLNQAFEKSDAGKVKGLMTDDHVAVTAYYGGPQTRDQQIEGLPDHKLTEYRVGKMKVRLLGKDAALVGYELAMKGTYKGKPVPARSYASAVWVRQGGKWREAFYQETALGKK